MDFTPAARSCFLGTSMLCRTGLGYELGQQGNRFPRLQAAQTGNECHPASQYIGVWGFPLEVKWPGCDVHKNEGSYTSTPYMPSWRGQGKFSFYREIP